MAAGLGFKTFQTGEVLTAADTNGYLMQGILVFADAAARTSAITAPQEGQYSFLKDTNALEYYDGAAWVGAPVGDITAVTAGTGISGGGSSGAVTITNSMATEIDAKGDLIVGTGADTFARLPVGTNGHTLVADSVETTGLKWVAPSAAGISWTLLNSGGTTLTGAQTITVSGISGKNDLFIYYTNASSASNSEIGFRFNTDTGNNYNTFGVLNLPTTAYSTNIFDKENRPNTSKIRSAVALAAGTAAGYLYVSGANTSGIKTVHGAGGAGSGDGTRQYIVGGFYDSASTITSVSLNSETGNFDGGTIYVYTSA